MNEIILYSLPISVRLILSFYITYIIFSKLDCYVNTVRIEYYETLRDQAVNSSNRAVKS